MDLANRLRQHNGELRGGAPYTTHHCPGTWRVKRFWPTRTCGNSSRDAYRDALKLEAKIKRACQWKRFHPTEHNLSDSFTKGVCVRVIHAHRFSLQR